MTKKRADTAKGPHELKSLRIDSIAACPAPAQEGAVARIIKSRSPANVTDELQVVAKRGALTTSVDGHVHRVRLDWGEGEITSGNTDGTTGTSGHWHTHPWVMGEDDAITIGEADGHTHEIATLSKSAGKAAKKLPKIADKAGLKAAIEAFEEADDKPAVAKHIMKRARELDEESMLPSYGELSEIIGKSREREPGDEAMPQDAAETNELKAQVAELTKSRDRFERIASLSDDERAVWKSLPQHDADAFLAGDVSVRKSRLDLAKASREVVYKSTSTGHEYTRADNAGVVAQAKALDEQITLAAKSRAESDERILKSRAAEFSFFGGSETARCALLKAVDTIADEKVRGEVTAALKARNDFMAKAGRTIGSSGSGSGEADAESAEGKLEAMAKSRVEKSGGKLTNEQAYAEVVGTPEGAKLVKAARSEQRRKFAAAGVGDDDEA